MKNFWHFGDSFTTPGNPKGWGFFLSSKLHRNFIHRGQSGASNYQILLNIMNELNNIKSDDIVLVNWSFLTRGVLFTKKGMSSTNRFFFDEGKEFNQDDKLNDREIYIKNKYIDSLEYLIKNSKQENYMVFMLAKSLQDFFEENNIRMTSVFLEKDWLTSNGKKVSWPDNNFNLHNLEFEPDYFKWLEKNNYTGDSELDTHYKDNISHIIGGEYYKRIVSPI